MSGDTIGIIYPPPELRNIVDKTANFVARNGPQFEERIQQNEQNNPKFNFLRNGDPYNGYYRHKVKEYQEAKEKGTSSSSQISAPPSSQVASGQQQTSSSGLNKTSKQLESLSETVVIIRDPPPEFEYSSDPPTLSAQELDVVKLTAQFVAIHGRSFLTNLMNRESRNYQFDFLKPQHGLFSYFTQLIEQYTKILMPPKTLASELRKEIENDKKILEKVRYRLEWTKIRDAEKKRIEEEAERERVQYAQIDWHDFVVVETVDYQPHEQGLFPPPTTPEQVGSRILLQQRIEEQGQEAIEMDVDSDEENATDGTPRHQPLSSLVLTEKITPAPAVPQPEVSKEKLMPPPPLPPSLDNALIKTDYDPKAPVKPVQQPSSVTTAKKDAWVISPITGEKIPAEKLQDHMRYGLLDPRWVEERERSIQEKMTQEEVYAPGTSIESSLKQLAERRTDIFGSGAEETAIGKKFGEEESFKAPVKPTWDGHTASADAVRHAARANITIEEQIQQIHKMKGLLPDDDKNKIGPAVVPSFNQQQQQQQNRPIQNPSTGLPLPIPQVTSGLSLQPTQMLISSTQGPFILPTPPMGMMGMYGMMGSTGPDGNPTGPPPPHPPLQASLFPQVPSAGGPGLLPVPGSTGMGSLVTPSDEPLAKKQKTEDTLIPEKEFIEQNPGLVTFRIQVPSVTGEKTDWNLSGQSLPITMELTESIGSVKKRIQEEIGLPPGKQKIQYEGMFLKDINSLAFYNVSNGSVMSLQLKVRGGR